MSYEPLPFVSVIIPVYNEERYIGACLRSLLRSAYPDDRWEIIVADGMSTDRTREEITQVTAASAVPIDVVDNPRRVTPVALNLAIGQARGEVIIRVDAHAEFGEDYVARCVTVLRESGADNVGGTVETRPGADTPMARAIARAMAHPFGVGNSAFRTQSEARETDTVPFGCFRREAFQRIGLFDERLWRNQDYEFNQRLRMAGGRLWLDPRLCSTYYSRATLPALLRHAWINGFWNALSHALHPYSFCLRHALPVGFVLGLAAAVIVSTAAVGTDAVVWQLLALLLWLPYMLYLAADVAVVAKLATSHVRDSAGTSFSPRGTWTPELETGMPLFWGGDAAAEKAAAEVEENALPPTCGTDAPRLGAAGGLALLVVFPAFHAWYGAGIAWGWVTAWLHRYPWGPGDGIPSWDERCGEAAGEKVNEK